MVVVTTGGEYEMEEEQKLDCIPDKADNVQPKTIGVEAAIEQPNSIEISLNAKLQFSGKCKCYAPTIEEAYNKAIEYAAKLETLIKEKNGI